MELDQVPRYYVMPLGACRAMTSCPLMRAALLRNQCPQLSIFCLRPSGPSDARLGYKSPDVGLNKLSLYLATTLALSLCVHAFAPVTRLALLTLHG